ncbi:TIM barrel protein [Paenibacillus oryzisoli]|uniref:hydroxypyruvate isomerase family protein n=1 Tax=Paenibacillus oryzisoli TaxID=1850517 RepID=UPI003D2CB5D7
MKFSPSLAAVFRGAGRTTRENIRLVREAGYTSFEFWSWWNEDLDEVEQVMKESGMTLGSTCTKMVSLTDRSQRENYLAGLRESINVANRLNCKYLISQTGSELAGVSRAEQAASLIEGLQAAAAILEGTDITLVIEPLNTRVDHKGYFLARSDEAFEIIRQVGSPQVKVLFDVYHQQITEGDVIRNFTANIADIGYFHIADNPGRHEIGTGEINYDNVLKAIHETGYTGFVGLEYMPKADAVQTLQQFRERYARFWD